MTTTTENGMERPMGSHYFGSSLVYDDLLYVCVCALSTPGLSLTQDSSVDSNANFA